MPGVNTTRVRAITPIPQDDLTSNEYVHKKAELRYMKIMHMRARGR